MVRDQPSYWIGFAWGVIVGTIATLVAAEPCEGYDVAATFDTVPGAEAYVVNVDGTITVVAAGGNPYGTTTVSVQAMGLGTVSAPSNTLLLEPQVGICEQADLNHDGTVSADDLLSLMLTVTEGSCQ